MGLYRKDDPTYRYVNDFAAGEAAGLRVTDVHYRLHGDRTGAGTAERIYVEMDTPYTYAGEAVKALAVINPDLKLSKQGAMPYGSDERLPGVRQYNDCMLFLAGSGKNLEDVSERETGTRAYVVMNGTEPLASSKALDEIGRFAAAASNYSAVMPFDEYKALQERNFRKAGMERLGIDPPGADGYVRYLEHSMKLMEDPHVKFVGRYTSPQQVQGLIDEFQMTQDLDEMKRNGQPGPWDHLDSMTQDQQMGE